LFFYFVLIRGPPFYRAEPGSRAVVSWADYLIATGALACVFVALYAGLIKF
jgi:hypothetical protein